MLTTESRDSWRKWGAIDFEFNGLKKHPPIYGDMLRAYNEGYAKAEITPRKSPLSKAQAWAKYNAEQMVIKNPPKRKSVTSHKRKGKREVGGW